MLEREDKSILALSDEELDQMEEDLAVLAEDHESGDEDTAKQTELTPTVGDGRHLGQAVPEVFPNVHQGVNLGGGTGNLALHPEPGKVGGTVGHKRPASQDLQASSVRWAPPKHP